MSIDLFKFYAKDQSWESNKAEVIIDINKKQKIDFVIIEHNMDFIMSLSDEIIVMAGGKTLIKGSPDEVRKNSKVLDSYLGYNEK